MPQVQSLDHGGATGGSGDPSQQSDATLTNAVLLKKTLILPDDLKDYVMKLLQDFNKHYPQHASVRHLDPIIQDDTVNKRYLLDWTMLTSENIQTLETYWMAEKHHKPTSTSIP